MSLDQPVCTRRGFVAALVMMGAWHSASALGQSARQVSPERLPAVAFPFYTGEQALQGLYAHHLPARYSNFRDKAQALAVAAQRVRAAPTPSAWAALWRPWRQTLLAWAAVSTPAIGPVLERRSQRRLDFWPTRPALLEKAVASEPLSLGDLDAVGSPAKGLPAMEHLLRVPMTPARCNYLTLLAEDIFQEAEALHSASQAWASRDWTADEAMARSALNEWVNQWWGGLERLRWAHIEQPLIKAQTLKQPAAYPRRALADNLSEWQMQWQSLAEQAGLPAHRLSTPPRPGREMIPIRALLMGKGHLNVANRWAHSLDTVQAYVNRLPAVHDRASLSGLLLALKRVSTLFQTEVATALDVSLGFSDADGD